MIYAYLVIALVAIGGGGFVAWKYTHAIEKAEQAEMAVEGWKGAATHWQAEQARTQRDFDESEEIARQRGKALDESKRRLEDARQSFARLAADSPSARDWLAGPVDPAVRRLRRSAAGCAPDFNVPCPAILVVTDGSAKDAGRDERGSPGGSAATPGSAPPVQ